MEGGSYLAGAVDAADQILRSVQELSAWGRGNPHLAPAALCIAVYDRRTLTQCYRLLPDARYMDRAQSVLAASVHGINLVVRLDQ